MRGFIPPLPNTPSWRGVQSNYRDNFTYTITIFRTIFELCLGAKLCQASLNLKDERDDSELSDMNSDKDSDSEDPLAVPLL
jgi:hypothetical protein